MEQSGNSWDERPVSLEDLMLRLPYIFDHQLSFAEALVGNEAKSDRCLMEEVTQDCIQQRIKLLLEKCGKKEEVIAESRGICGILLLSGPNKGKPCTKKPLKDGKCYYHSRK